MDPKGTIATIDLLDRRNKVNGGTFMLEGHLPLLVEAASRRDTSVVVSERFAAGRRSHNLIKSMVIIRKGFRGTVSRNPSKTI